ncbi:MAG: CoA transferase [Acidobacteriota bacterium]|nr:CoA transferase [Acidobacteriota bacterium]
MTRPLNGIKVLEFSEHGFVPSAAAILADFGADVVKIERPGGDAMRRIISAGLVPSVDGYDFLFELVNRNKRGIAVDVEVESGRQVFERLVGWADVYVTNQLPRVRRKLRTDPADIFAIKPKLVYAKGHGQGQRGEDADAGGYDAVSFWARGGLAHVLTDPDAPEPAQPRPALGDLPSGMFFAGGICAALVHVLRTGEGIVVDTSLLGGAVWTMAPDLAYASIAGRQLHVGAGPRSPLTRQYKTSDGRFVSFMMIDESRYWAQACRALGLDDLIGRYSDDESRRAAWPRIRTRITEAVATMTAQGIERRLRAEDCIFSFFATPSDVLRDPSVEDNGYLMSHPDREGLLVAAAPVQFDDETPAIRRPGPGIGQHSREVLGELGYESADIEDLVRSGAIVTAGESA